VLGRCSICHARPAAVHDAAAVPNAAARTARAAARAASSSASRAAPCAEIAAARAWPTVISPRTLRDPAAGGYQPPPPPPPTPPPENPPLNPDPPDDPGVGAASDSVATDWNRSIDDAKAVAQKTFEDIG